uniref:Uncharacterized protein LOC114346053 n=1 Tax=Diabrotica virgifera virgifera TaxID=50390 RepID=A0A6P7H4Q4_DIAVI
MYKYFLLVFAVCVLTAVVAKADEEDNLFDPYRLPLPEKEIDEFVFNWYKQIFTKEDRTPEQKKKSIASFRANFKLLMACLNKYSVDEEALKSCSIKYKLPNGMTLDDGFNTYFILRPTGF